MERRIIKLPNEVTGELEECWYSEKLGRTVKVGSDEERMLLEEEEGRTVVPEVGSSASAGFVESGAKAVRRGRNPKVSSQSSENTKRGMSRCYIYTDVMDSLRLLTLKMGRSTSMVDFVSRIVEEKVKKELEKYGN